MNRTEKEDTSKLPYSDEDYYRAALLLSRTYPAMKSERENIRKWQTGEKKYTEDDALEDLVSVTPKGDNDLGVAVQTSGTSDKTASVAMKLASGYVKKRQAQIMRELFSTEMLEHISYLDWKIEIVEAAMSERMTKLQRVIYQLIFFKGYSYSKLVGGNKGKKRLNDWKINSEKNKAIDAVAGELKLMDSGKEELQHLNELMDEYRKEKDS